MIFQLRIFFMLLVILKDVIFILVMFLMISNKIRFTIQKNRLFDPQYESRLISMNGISRTSLTPGGETVKFKCMVHFFSSLQQCIKFA